MSASGGLVAPAAGRGANCCFDWIQFVVLAGGMASLFTTMCPTRGEMAPRPGRAGCLWPCIELAKKVLAVYLGKAPTYSVVYGAFATLPILLVWICMWPGHCAAGCGGHGLFAQPAGGRGAARYGGGLDVSAGGGVLQQLHRVRQQPPKACAPASWPACCGWMGCSCPSAGRR